MGSIRWIWSLVMSSCAHVASQVIDSGIQIYTSHSETKNLYCRYPARKIVADACASACPEYYTSTHPAGTQNGHLKLDADSRTLILPRCCPWQEHLLDIEHELNIASDKDKQILYCIFPDSRSGSFRIQAVPKIRGSFENRKPLPKPWRGVRDDELSGVAGIPGCVFTHASGFIGGNQTLEGAKEMARKAVEFPVEQNL